MKSPPKAAKKTEDEQAEMEALVLLSSCISNMSNQYEQTCRKFEEKLNTLESNSKGLNAKFEALQRG